MLHLFSHTFVQCFKFKLKFSYNSIQNNFDTTLPMPKPNTKSQAVYTALAAPLIVATMFSTSAYAATASDQKTLTTAERSTAIATSSKLDIAAKQEQQAIQLQSQSPSKAQPISSQPVADKIIAVVNDQPILQSELEQAIAAFTQQAKAQGQTLPNQNVLKTEALNALIVKQLQMSLVNRIGIRPDTQRINASLLQIANSQGLGSLAELQQQLDAQNPGSYQTLRQQLIDKAAIQALQQREIASRIRISDQDINAFLNSPEAKQLNQNEYRTIHLRVPFMDDYSRLTNEQRQQTMTLAQQLYLLLSKNELSTEQVMDEMQSKYNVKVQGGDMGYHRAAGLPTQLSTIITGLKKGQVSEPIVTPQGIDVVKLADIKSNADMIVPQWHTRHILIKVDDLQTNEIAKAKIDNIYEKLRQGADFGQLASTYSNDLGSARKGGDLGWVEQKQMVPAFEQIMINTPVTDYSTPFKTNYGWHILKVDEVRQKDISEEFKRQRAKNALYERASAQALEDWLQELKTSAYIQTFD